MRGLFARAAIALVALGAVSVARAGIDPAARGLAVSPTRPVLSAGLTNGVYNASMCGTSARPAWCAGSDIGAWINSAFAAGNLGSANNVVRVILDPNQTYVQTTKIVKPLNAGLDGRGATISWPSLTGTAIVHGYGQNNIWARQPLENIHWIGPGAAQSGNISICMFFGGDPAGILSPVETIGQGATTININCEGFRQTKTWGNNAWSMIGYDSSFHDNYDGIVAPKYGTSAQITAFSIASNVVTFQAPNTYSVGQIANITGMSGASYLVGVPFTITAATSTSFSANLTRADVASTTMTGAAYVNGVHNSGELIHEEHANISNNLNCGLVGQDTTQAVSLNQSHVDYNGTNDICGGGNWQFNMSHLERTSGPFGMFTAGASVAIRAMNSNFVYTGTTGTDNGLFDMRSVSGSVTLKDNTFYSAHKVNLMVYTNGANASKICVAGFNYLLVTGSQPLDSDSINGGLGCTTMPGANNGFGWPTIFNYNGIAGVFYRPEIDTNNLGNTMCQFIGSNSNTTSSAANGSTCYRGPLSGSHRLYGLGSTKNQIQAMIDLDNGLIDSSAFMIRTANYSGVAISGTTGGTGAAITANSTAASGEITLGTSATGWAITFTTPYQGKPACLIQPQGSAPAPASVSFTTAGITVTNGSGTASSGAIFTWICFPRGG